MQRAALDFLWGGGWQEVVLERVVASNATAVNASAGGLAGMTIKAIALPPVGALNVPNRALNARFAGGCSTINNAAQSHQHLRLPAHSSIDGYTALYQL